MWVFMHYSEMRSVGAQGGICSHMCRTYPGWCIHDHSCDGICKAESEANIGGACEGNPTRLCFCQTPCPS
ncbi:hypothetical protein PVAP13_6NG336200 [Panicum virgatum]|uniref:Knottins-like domain-containing protein n=1 Tax=Panicum virgatum TaxID=38727 RepID=A0A8T0R410_PANVG|nr:hypothetical protein PVAP13_6NG336200 [Panicum virgatum]